MTQWFPFRDFYDGEGTQIETMDIPRCLDLVCNRDWELVDIEAVFTGEGSSDLSRCA